MGSSYESHSNNGYTIDTNLQIIRHPSYQTSPRFSLSWFDVRVFYVRVSNFLVDESAPEYLTLNHIPLSPETILEVNGVRCSTDSEEGLTSVLRRDRVDKKSEEATYVSTDSIRLTGSAKFEVFDKNNLVISGILEMSSANGNVRESYNDNNISKGWNMNCESTISAGMGFLKGKQVMGSESLLPNIEVYVAGRFSGTPIILTRNLQISPRKKQQRKGVLDSIPECDGTESNGDLSSVQDLQVAEYRSYKPQQSDEEEEEEEEDYDSLYWRQREYFGGEDGELSWFNAGVRVGVGIGLGICVGVGIGVGLLVRTYQTTARTFKRRLL